MKLYNQVWHTDACVREQEQIKNNGRKMFWCKTHGQWAAELPTKVTTIYEYGDGTSRIDSKEAL